jgi:uncharacterized membrane protein YiaA
MELRNIRSGLIPAMARTGLIAKGFVYVILGLIAFMAAFHLKSNESADRTGSFQFIHDAPGGNIILALLAIGLVCYSLWRFIQAFSNSDSFGRRKFFKRARYFFSGLGYLAVAYSALNFLIHPVRKQDQNQQTASELLNRPFGEWLVGLGAIIIAAIGIYQVWYGLSEKYKNHVQKLNLQEKGTRIILSSGTWGYLSRGIVWLIISFLLLRAALHSAAAEAGDTSKAFEFIRQGTAGSWLCGAIGIGLVIYGLFNFTRARYERIQKF